MCYCLGDVNVPTRNSWDSTVVGRGPSFDQLKDRDSRLQLQKTFEAGQLDPFTAYMVGHKVEQPKIDTQKESMLRPVPNFDLGKVEEPFSKPSLELPETIILEANEAKIDNMIYALQVMKKAKTFIQLSGTDICIGNDRRANTMLHQDMIDLLTLFKQLGAKGIRWNGEEIFSKYLEEADKKENEAKVG